MTITVTTTSSGPYAAVGDDTFAVTFQSASETEIRVTLDDVDISPGAYVFTRDEDGTGEVVLDDAVTGEVMIYSEPELTQPTEFLRYGAWYPDLMNGPLDRVVAQILYIHSLVAGVVVGAPGEDGDDGLSAYEVAVANGFVGSEAAWLASLEGEDGDDGAPATNPNFSVLTGAAGTNVLIGGTYPDLILTIPRGDTGLSGAGTGDLIAANNLNDLANVATARTNLGLAIGTDVQAFDADLSTIAANITAAGHALLDDASAAAQRVTLSLGNVDNTSDANKPVSTPQQTALDLKADLASPALTGNPTAPTQVWGTADTKLATTAFVDRLRDLPLIRATASPTAALTDRGGVVEATTSAALPANGTVAFPVGSLVTFYNDSGVAINLTITTDTLRLAGTTSTGTRSIAARGYAFCRKRATTEWTVSGDVS